jgi:hypothetical protein
VRVREEESRLLGEALKAACVVAGIKAETQRKLGAALRNELALLEAEPVPASHRVLPG